MKIQLWVCGRYWPIIARFVASKVQSIPKPRQNFLSLPDSKIDNFFQKNHPPPPLQKKSIFWGSNFITGKCCLRQKSLHMFVGLCRNTHTNTKKMLQLICGQKFETPCYYRFFSPPFFSVIPVFLKN